MIELPRVLVNMARSIPMWLWYWSPEPPPQYQKKISVQTFFGGAYCPAFTVSYLRASGPSRAGQRRPTSSRAMPMPMIMIPSDSVDRSQLSYSVILASLLPQCQHLSMSTQMPIKRRGRGHQFLFEGGASASTESHSARHKRYATLMMRMPMA